MNDSRVDIDPSQLTSSKETIVPEVSKIKKEEAIALYSRSLAFSISNGLVSPFVSFIALKLGSTAGVLAWIQAVANLLRQFLDPIFGRISDMIKRRIPFIVISTITWTIPYVFLYWVKAPGYIILITAIVNILLSFGNPAWIALQNELFPEEVRGKLTGRVTWFGSFGSMLATLFTGILLTFAFGENIDYQKYILIPVAVGIFISILAVLPFRKIKEPLQKKGATQEKTTRTLKESLKEVFSNKPFMKFTILYSIFGIFWTFSWPLFSLKQVNILDATAVEIALMEIIFALTSLLFILLGARVADKFGRTKLVFLNRFCLFLFPLSYIFATQIWHLYIIHFAVSCLFSFGFAGVNAYLLDIVPKKDTGLYYGVLSLVTGVAYFIGTLLGGYMVEMNEFLLNTSSISVSLTTNIPIVNTGVDLAAHTIIGQSVMLDTFNLALIIALAFVAGIRFILSFSFLTLKEVKEFNHTSSKKR